MFQIRLEKTLPATALIACFNLSPARAGLSPPENHTDPIKIMPAPKNSSDNTVTVSPTDKVAA